LASLPVVYSALAGQQLRELRRYIETRSGEDRANAFVDSIIDYCNGLTTFPERGRKRNDLLPGLRVVGFRWRAIVAFTIESDAVVIQGVFYGGQDFESAFQD
jgi:toxin ParE1/3/4